MSWLRTDPVVLLGMHRSGTTMLARMLDRLGVFLGHRLESNHEAIAVLELNDEVLARAHAAWDRPLGMLDLLGHGPSTQAVVDSMRTTLDTFGFRRSYLGATRLGRGLGPGPWGFKDPRTTVTWPLWLEIAPDARLVMMRRHGVDVAASLWRRARAQLDDDAARFAGDAHMARFASVRCLELDRAFELWAETEEAFETLRTRHPDAAVYELIYEDLVTDPRAALSDVCEFLDVEVEPGDLEAAAGTADPSRALAHRDDPTLRDFAESVLTHPRLARWEAAR
ncbi:MAG TPA: sulfotransferase [Candidatus Krumholzibacteria bacterium]|nr:sulfotransferase [Candidatus Krumholzibacteria bacterium]